MVMDIPPTASKAPKSASRATLDKTITRTILVLFLTACIITTTSHHLVNRDLKHKAENESKLLSVPKPRIREAAKGGLPPIPDFVKKKTAEHHRKEVEAKVEQAQLALQEAQAELAIEQNEDPLISPDSTRYPLKNTTNEMKASTDIYPYPNQVISPKSKVLLQPTYGKHRPRKNAVFAFAEGYPLDVYVTFVESLKLTGFNGDVVFAVSSESEMKRDVANYLKSYGDATGDVIRVISYALPWECFKKNGEPIPATRGNGRGSTTNNGFSDCQIHGIYSEDDGVSPAKDPRIARPVATARYEMYWIWSGQYETSSRILILDVRDSYFQSNPFEFEQSAASNTCTLDLFEENREAVNIGKSSYNSKWVKTAYGNRIFDTMSDKPVICSGSTMGSQHAIELYTRAMIAQFDKSKCKQVGCDQGFHNGLYYDPDATLNGVLAKEECSIHVYKQGEGAVNNLAAMRTSTLRSQGVLVDGSDNNFEDGFAVVNTDKVTSPVIHQYDRDKELKDIIQNRTKRLMRKWMKSNADYDVLDNLHSKKKFRYSDLSNADVVYPNTR